MPPTIVPPPVKTSPRLRMKKNLPQAVPVNHPVVNPVPNPALKAAIPRAPHPPILKINKQG